MIMAPPHIALIFLCIMSSQVLLLMASPNPPNTNTSTSTTQSFPKGGFSLEIIPPHSPKSPLYKYHLFTNGNKYSPLLRRYRGIFLVQVGIGTFGPTTPPKDYYLTMDTGSDLIWVQCEECKLAKGGKCYAMKPEPFPNRASQSYKPIKYDEKKLDPLCRPKQSMDGFCSYFVGYDDHGYSKGILARETLTFHSTTTTPPLAAIEGIGFGCGVDSAEPLSTGVKDYQIAGIFGLARGPPSFVRQLEAKGVKINGRFSYCLVNYDGETERPPPLYLRFGDDIEAPRQLQSVAFSADVASDYGVNLKAIGMGGKKVILDEKSRCIIDSGYTFSHIAGDAYKNLVAYLHQHFSGLKFQPYDKIEGFTCYRRGTKERLGYKDVPGLTFYFDNNVELKVAPQRTFDGFVDADDGFEVFCLYVKESDHPHETVLGAIQQANLKFIYDINSNKLQFGPEDCTRNG